jgi:hypothetical protein
MEEIKRKTFRDPVSDEAMERLVKIMTNSPTLVKLQNTEFEITALKPGTQWKIAEEATKINKIEKATFGDILQGLSQEFPVVCKILALAILNDKKAIEENLERFIDVLLWECESRDWGQLLFEVLNLINVDVFFSIINSIQTFRMIVLERKMKTTEQK